MFASSDVGKSTTPKAQNGTEKRQQKHSGQWATFGDTQSSVIPHDMILFNSSLLWCPNAKAGTSTVYQNILYPNNLIPEHEGNRCHNKCPIIAWRQLKNWTSTKPLSFTIVRNPWDRLRSAYLNKIATGTIQIQDEQNHTIETFAEFVRYVEEHPTKNIHWSPVTDRCLTGPRAIDGYSNKRVFQYDYILKLEEGDLVSRVEKIFAQAGIPLPAGVAKERKNVSSKPQGLIGLVEFYREEAAAGNTTLDELVASVGRTYRDDIEAHGYSFPSY